MANDMRFVKTVDIGITIRGKYTFPKIAELVVNVLAVWVKQFAKYVHKTVPLR